jgi:hypothetical protein
LDKHHHKGFAVFLHFRVERGTVVGTVQPSFVARNTLNGRDAINTQAYIKLLEAAQGRYAVNDIQIDIRDIVWVSGKDVGPENKEYAATGKVGRFP